VRPVATNRDAFFVEAGRAACGAPTPVSTTGPNILLVGDSISMGGSGYSLFVQVPPARVIT
jgi:hypothetical protein